MVIARLLHHAVPNTLQRLALGILILAAALGGPAVGREEPREPPGRSLAFGVGSLSGILVLPVGRAPVGLVVVLHDSLGPDQRIAPYLDQFLGAGIGVLTLLRDDADGDVMAQLVPALAADARIGTQRIGVLGFGRGARHALEAQGHGILARALLYPGCEGLEALPGPAGQDPLLLLHGEADEANRTARCTDAAAALAQSGRRVRHIAYPDAGYAWDHPLYGVERRMMLPRPDGPGRVAALPWPELAMLSATQVTGFFLAAFAPRGP